MTKRIQITTNSVEDGLLEELLVKKGWEYKDSFRLGLRLFYEQEIKKQKKPDSFLKNHPETMNKDYCKQILHGDIVEQDGILCCEYKVGACTMTEPLDQLKKK